MPYDVHSLIGKRVRLSAEGRKVLLQFKRENHDWVGVVVGVSRIKYSVKVLWDGLSHTDTIHVKFIEPAGDEAVDFSDLGLAMVQAGLHEKAETASSSALVLAQKVVELNAKVAALQDRVDDLERLIRVAGTHVEPD